MARRLHELGLLSDWRYRTLRIELAKQGEGKDGPAGEPRETSLMLQKVFAALRAQGITRRTITEVLQVNPKDVDELGFGLSQSLAGHCLALPSFRTRSKAPCCRCGGRR